MNLPPPTPKQAKIIWLALTGLSVALLVGLVVALVWGLGQALHLLSPVLWPLAVAGVLAYLLDPVVDFLERRKIPRTRAISCVFVFALMLLVTLFSSVVPQIVVESRQLAGNIPTFTTNLTHRIEGWINQPPSSVRRFLGSGAAVANTNAVTDASAASQTNVPSLLVSTNAPAAATTAPSNYNQAMMSAADWLTKVAPDVGKWVLGQAGRVLSWFGVLAGLALIPVYLFYFLLEKKGIESKWTDYLPVSSSSFKDELVFILRSINAYLIVFFRSQVLVAMCDGVLYAIGFALIGLPYSVLLGVMATVLTMIPFLGAIATCATALILAFVQFGDWQHPMLVLAVFGVVQTLEGLVIQPKIMGERVGLHPLTIIVAVMIGTTMLGGILGGVLAIPLTAALRVLMFRYVWKRADGGRKV